MSEKSTAPEFKLRNQDDQWVTLESLARNGPVVLAFYPGDFTPVCTKQLCGYQTELSAFNGLGIQLVGISSDSPESHRKFKAKFGLQFPLLSDPAKEVFRAYGATSPLLLGATSRAIIIVSPDRQVVYRKVEAVPITHRNAEELLRVVTELRAKGALPLASD